MNDVSQEVDGDGSQPCVGIFWRVAQEAGSKLVCHVVSLEEADPYGDFLTHPTGHYEIWEGWKQAGVMALKSMGLPPEIAFTEYEDHPRGRVVYNSVSREFTIYADRRLQGRKTIADLAELFGIERSKFVVRSDSHYVSRPPSRFN